MAWRMTSHLELILNRFVCSENDECPPAPRQHAPIKIPEYYGGSHQGLVLAPTDQSQRVIFESRNQG